jgi:hypothetical protein
MSPGAARGKEQKNGSDRAVFGLDLAAEGQFLCFWHPTRAFFILITTPLEHGSTKNALGLRFAEVDFLMNAPYLYNHN